MGALALQHSSIHNHNPRWISSHVLGIFTYWHVTVGDQCVRIPYIPVPPSLVLKAERTLHVPMQTLVAIFKSAAVKWEQKESPLFSYTLLLSRRRPSHADASARAVLVMGYH